ncbi:MAG TPA: AAA family ATPase [Symbiobacteriaceae bacterium]|jgi:MinD-like ATPase involved in chromosome partitioning or flagellar assembly|nr:AAA family ATPase [Symbiobacteriaceae bacterium]
METVLAMPSPDRGRDFVVPLSLGGLRVRSVVQTGNQLVAELSREPAECILLPEVLPDGAAELWLTKVAAVCPRRPMAVVLVYGVEAVETVRERVRSAYGPAADVVAAGARNVDDVSGEVCRVAERVGRILAEQDRDAFERLRQPVPPGQVPQPVRKSGAVAFLGASGGVGTSTLVANLAVYAAMAGQRVLVVDAHFATGGTVLYHLGAEPDDVNRGVHHLRWAHMSNGGPARDNSSDELMRRTEEVRLRGVRHAELRVLHIPAILEQMASLPADLLQWAMHALERSFDLILIDGGTGLGDPRTQKLLEQAGRIVLMAGGWGSGVHALVRGLTALDGSHDDRIFLVLRESEGAYGSRTVRSLANMPIFGRVPEEPLLRKMESRLGARLPVAADSPDSPYGRAVAQLAFALGMAEAAAAREPRSKRGLMGLFSGKNG